MQYIWNLSLWHEVQMTPNTHLQVSAVTDRDHETCGYLKFLQQLTTWCRLAWTCASVSWFIRPHEQAASPSGLQCQTPFLNRLSASAHVHNQRTHVQHHFLWVTSLELVLDNRLSKCCLSDSAARRNLQFPTRCTNDNISTTLRIFFFYSPNIRDLTWKSVAKASSRLSGWWYWGRLSLP